VKGKAMLLIGGVAGYVLGARAGRERYEQVKNAAGRAWGNPRVQEARRTASEQVKEKVEEGVREARDRMAGHGGSAVEDDRHPVGTHPGA
jgi:hypothetical protein